MKKKFAEKAVENLKTEGKKGEDAKEENVEKWMKHLVNVLPDIGEVAINLFINPISGLSTVFKKIAEKIKSNASKQSKGT